MSLSEKINESLKEAMKSKNEAGLRTFRAIKAAILLAKTEKGGQDELSEQQEMQILQKLAKQRKESIEIFKAQDRPELAKAEEEELHYIEKLLPAQMSETEVRNIIRNLITQNGFSSKADMAKLMPMAMQALSGKADGKLISTIVKEELQM